MVTVCAIIDSVIFSISSLFVICHMAFIYIDRNATTVNKLQVAIKYTFDLEVRNVRGQIVSIFFPGGSYVSATIFL